MNTFEIKKGYFRVYDGKTSYDYHVDSNHDYSGLLDPEYIYGIAVNKGLSSEETIDLMLKYLHKRRIVKVHHLINMSICVTLIGNRGSGKSVGGTHICVVDGLLAGRKVVSNLPIALKVRYKDAEKTYESVDLDAVTMLDFNDFDTNYEDCWIFIDETNVDIADSQRSTSNQALFFSHILQQMRKRKLDFIFTTQSETFLPSRARWQTDIFIKCSDLAMTSTIYPKVHDIGRKSRWQLYDFSGMLTNALGRYDEKKVSEFKPYASKIVWNVPFWNCYSTELMQRWDKLKLKTTGKKNVIPGFFDSVAERFNISSELLLKAIGESNCKVPRSELWEKLGVVGDKSAQINIGKLYKKLEIESFHTSRGNEYLFPPQSEILRRIGELTFESELEALSIQWRMQ